MQDSAVPLRHTNRPAHRQHAVHPCRKANAKCRIPIRMPDTAEACFSCRLHKATFLAIAALNGHAGPIRVIQKCLEPRARNLPCVPSTHYAIRTQDACRCSRPRHAGSVPRPDLPVTSIFLPFGVKATCLPAHAVRSAAARIPMQGRGRDTRQQAARCTSVACGSKHEGGVVSGLDMGFFQCGVASPDTARGFRAHAMTWPGGSHYTG